jgi:hypothetical protein
LVASLLSGPKAIFRLQVPKLHGKIDAIKKVNPGCLFCWVERDLSFLFLHEIPVSWSLKSILFIALIRDVNVRYRTLLMDGKSGRVLVARSSVTLIKLPHYEKQETGARSQEPEEKKN